MPRFIPRIRLTKFSFGAFPRFRYIILALVLYLGFLIASLPAQLVYAYSKQMLGQKLPLTMTEVDGSIWTGSAGQSKFGTQVFDSVQWRFRPLRLLTGHLELGWEFTIPDGYAKGIAGVNFMGRYYMKQLEGLVPMGYLAKAAKVEALRPGGSMDISLDNVEFNTQSITAVSGNVAWHGAEITLLKPMRLGDFKVALESGAEGIKGVLSDAGGPLQLEGLLTLDGEGSYQFNGTLMVRDTSQTDLVNAMRSLGRPDAGGKYKIKQSGKLSQLRL